MKVLFQQYRRIILPLVAVIFFDLSLLGVNFYLSSQLEASSININIAGRQRMLSQRMTKSLVFILYRKNQSLNFDQDQNELRTAVRLFDQTLLAFAEGGSATGAAGDKIFVEKLGGERFDSILTEAQWIWKPLFSNLNTMFLDNSFQLSEIQSLIDLLSVNNLKLLNLMNDLTVKLEKDAKQKTYFLRGLQTIIVILILVSFIIAIVRFIRREKYYNHLMEKSTDVVIGIDVSTAVTTFVSNSVTTVLGHDTDYYYAKPASLFFESESAVILTNLLEYIRRTGKLEKDRNEVTLVKSDGSFVVSDMVMQLSNSEDGQSMELSVDIRDISERKEAEIALTELAHKDVLTNLPNRLLFYDLAENALELAKRYQKQIAIMFIDLDGFKSINDQFGHETGDKALIEVGHRLTSCLRSSDVVARMGGDEFTVTIQNVQNNDDLKVLATKIITALSKKIVVSSQKLQLGASIGIAIYPENGSDVSQLVRKADRAMYKVKESGKNNIIFAQ